MGMKDGLADVFQITIYKLEPLSFTTNRSLDQVGCLGGKMAKRKHSVKITRRAINFVDYDLVIINRLFRGRIN